MNFIQDETDYRKISSEKFRKRSYGNKNIHKKFKVLCNRNPLANKQGLISTIFLILPNIIEAREHGYIPVIDLCMNSHPSIMFQERELAKKENAWEYYFTQPDKEWTLGEVRQSRHVEEQRKYYCSEKYRLSSRSVQWDDNIEYISMAIRKNIHLQSWIRDRVISERSRIFSKQDKILGVAIRSGYRSGIMRNLSIYEGHPLVESCEYYISEIEKRLSEWGYNSFFLEIDDRGYLEEIKRYFGSSCIYFERPRLHYFKDALGDIPYEKTDDIFMELKECPIRQQNEEYLVGLYLLAQCDSLYASRGTGHNFAYLLNHNKFSHVEFVESEEFHYEKK